MIALPLRNDLPHYTFVTQLEDRSYKFALDWNSRESSWYISIYTEEGDPIAVSIKVVLDWPLFLVSRDVRMPPGNFTAIDTEGSGVPPGLVDLGSRVVIFYTTLAEASE